jgi:hypothetical protein
MNYKLFSLYPNIVHLLVYLILRFANWFRGQDRNLRKIIDGPVLIIDTLSGEKNNQETIFIQCKQLKDNIFRNNSQKEIEEFVLDYSITGYFKLGKKIMSKKFIQIHFLSPNITVNIRNFGFILSHYIYRKVKKNTSQCVLYIWDAYDVGNLIFIEIFRDLNLKLVSLSSDLEKVSQYGQQNLVKVFNPSLYLQEYLVLSEHRPLKLRKVDLRIPNLANFSFRVSEVSELMEYLESKYQIDTNFYKSYNEYLESLLNVKFTVVVNSLKKRSFNQINRILFKKANYSHLVGRNFEAIMAGSLLFTQDSLEVTKIFTHRMDAIIWRDIGELKENLDYYASNLGEANKIASEGSKTYLRLVTSAKER